MAWESGQASVVFLRIFNHFLRDGRDENSKLSQLITWLWDFTNEHVAANVVHQEIYILLPNYLATESR